MENARDFSEKGGRLFRSQHDLKCQRYIANLPDEENREIFSQELNVELSTHFAIWEYHIYCQFQRHVPTAQRSS